jgi:hypothetical protein
MELELELVESGALVAFEVGSLAVGGLFVEVEV